MNIIIYRMPDEIAGGAIKANFVLAVNGVHILQSHRIHGFSTVSPDSVCPADLQIVAESLELALHSTIQYRDKRIKPQRVVLRGAPIRLLS
jgi:hypothetical protein